MAMAMAASLAAHHHLAGGGLLPTPRASGRNGRSGITISMRAQRKQSGDSGSGKGDGGDGRVSGRRRVWRRRKLDQKTQDGTSFQNGAVLQAVLLRTLYGLGGFGDTSHHFHDQMPPISRSLIFCKKFTRLNVQ
uniref:Uncharacterized protein n=1 Tax=Oryza nivara TaxID=4536 RepID=A0A0E0FRV9_ORYNI